MDVLAIENSPETIAAKTAAIHQALLATSPRITQANFTVIGPDDLLSLLDHYDRSFFGGWLGQAVRAKTAGPTRVRLSGGMTRAGGKTTRYRTVTPRGEKLRYEIAIAHRMLFMTFGEIDRPVTVCGLPCGDRLQALQRIIEHEIIHLVEMLVWDESSCSGIRFKKLASRIFGHTDTHHALVTPREHAAVRHGIRVGSQVEFDFEGRLLSGRVNRIHRRATVLVEDDRGLQYSDGRRYAKIYVPLALLRPCAAEAGT
jgi:hypothetical protein